LGADKESQMSGKVKEIEVWVQNQVIINNIEALDTSFAVYTRERKHTHELYGELSKAKLIIELPERKVEITESMLDNALKEYESQGSCAFFKNILKQKLFGEKREG
jgi:hypothetical protein